MLQLSEGMLLYHGSYCEVKTPNLAKYADRFCIGRLIPERLRDQFCFRTAKGLQCLSFEGSERIWKN